MANEQALKKSKELNNSNILDISSQENAAPVAQDDEITGAFSGMLRITPEELLANDSDLDGDTFRGASIQGATNGTVYWDGTHVVFVAEKGYSGPASFSYTITDDKGGFDTATVNLTIIPNTPPEAVDDLIAGISNRQIVIAPETLLANDSDIDGDRIEGIAIQDAENGVLTWDGQYLTFTPDEGYEGPASFTYTITDHNGGEDTATVNINIKTEASVTGRFEAIDNKIFSKVDGTIEIPENFLTDDDKGTDKTILNVHSAKNGTVELVNGVVKFTPDDGYLGPAEFSYTLQGNDGLTDIARVEIEVQAPWEIVNEFTKDQISDPESIDAGYGLSYNINYNGDIGYLTNQNSYIYNAENTSVEGGNGYLNLLPQDGFVGIASFDYIKRPSRWNAETQETEYSNWFEMGTAKFNVQESPVPLPEGIGDEVVVTSHNGTIKVPLEALVLNDHRGFDTDTVSAENIQSVQSAVNGTVEIIGGNVIFTPAAGYIGEASFVYTVTVGNETKDVPVTLTIGESSDPTAMIARDDYIDLGGRTYDQYTFSRYTSTVNDQQPYGDKYPEKIIAVQDAILGRVELAVIPSSVPGWGGYESIVYTPDDLNYDGQASFDYVAANTLGSISIATVTFDVTSNKAPQVNNETLFMTRNTAKVKQEWLLQNDIDTESYQTELTEVINPFGVSIDEQYRYLGVTINDAPFNVDAPLFQYTVSDGRLSSTGQVNVVQQADSNFVGTDGTDIMYASNDNNILDGGAGNDFINSGDGDDTITGGLGSDVFFWTLSDAPGEQTNLGNNAITDFNLSEDKLDLRDVFGYLDAFGPNQPTLLEQLDARMDFTLSDGNTEINLQGTQRGLQEPFVGKFTLENVDLFALTGVEGANDLDILQSSFRNNLVGYE